MKSERMASARILDVTAQDGLYLVQLYSVVTEYIFFIHFPFFFSHDGKETKDQAPSMLPPHTMLTHPRRWGRASRRSREWLVHVWSSAKGKMVHDA